LGGAEWREEKRHHWGVMPLYRTTQNSEEKSSSSWKYPITIPLPGSIHQSAWDFSFENPIFLLLEPMWLFFLGFNVCLEFTLNSLLWGLQAASCKLKSVTDLQLGWAWFPVTVTTFCSEVRRKLCNQPVSL
jgi:hypothetical protein